MPLKPGDTIRRHGQAYHCIELEPYVRKDGLPVELAMLESKCPECGSAFHLLVSNRKTIHRKLTRRCPLHRKPGHKIVS